jgi:hypothetical protein
VCYGFGGTSSGLKPVLSLCVTLFFCYRGVEEPVPISKTLRSKSTLKKAFSTSSIPKEVVSSSLVAVEDIDKDDNGDPFLVPEYVNDIYAYLREVEVRS